MNVNDINIYSDDKIIYKKDDIRQWYFLFSWCVKDFTHLRFDFVALLRNSL